jgi:aryl carrier-like protein
MSERANILREIQTIAAEHDKTLPPLTDDLALLDSGLDSLCLAILVSRLEDITGRDPFASQSTARFPRTVGELIEFYDQALA